VVLFTSVLLVALAAALVAELFFRDALRDSVHGAAATFFFVVVLGGFIKVLIDRSALQRAERLEHVQFLTSLLSDFKAAHDQVERARILIPAHQSATTLDEAMSSLIDARVTLLNVGRALSSSARLCDDTFRVLTDSCGKMSGFLYEVIRGFGVHYRDVADRQRVYHGLVEASSRNATADSPFDLPPNEAWAVIEGLTAYKLLSVDDCDHPILKRRRLEEPPSEYKRRFLDPLDAASAVLRSEILNPTLCPREPVDTKPAASASARNDAAAR
jgi:hypothetical protein